VPEALRVLLPLLVSAIGTGAVAAAGTIRPRSAAPLAVATATLAFLAVLLTETGAAVSYAWAPTWGLRLGFATDGLARMYALLATGIGVLVLLYASGYVPLHLKHTRSDPSAGRAFSRWSCCS